MRLSPLPLLVPTVLTLILVFGVQGLAHSRHDYISFLVTTVGAAAGLIVAAALHVWTVNDRLRQLERTVEKLQDRIYRSETPGDGTA